MGDRPSPAEPSALRDDPSDGAATPQVTLVTPASDAVDLAAAERRALGEALAGLAARLDVLEPAVMSVGPAAEGLARRLDSLEAASRDLGPSLAGLAARIDALEGAATYTMALHAMAARLDTLETAAAVEATSRWIAQAELTAGPLISVIIPTRDRPGRLQRAIASVLAQTYEHWELIVVDDGGDMDSAAVVADAGDTRIHHIAIESAGVCAARNRGLELATGAVITYLDDDNTYDRGWLKAVAWAFSRWPDVDVLYGGMVIEDFSAATARRPGGSPQLWLRPYRRSALLEDNLTDVSALAHRAGLPQAHFDPEVSVLADWDLLLRLTTRKAPHVVPVISCYYSTGGSDRMSLDEANAAAARARILAAHAVERRLLRDDPD